MATSGCAGTPPGAGAAPAPGMRAGAGNAGLPAWLSPAQRLLRRPELDEAAALLCARDTGGVIDEEVRRQVGVVEGQVSTLIGRGTLREAREVLRAGLPAALREVSANQVGFAERILADGRSCTAAVVARALGELTMPGGRARPLPPSLAPDASLSFSFRPEGGAQARVELFVLRPDGRVSRRGLEAAEEVRVDFQPEAGEGRYRLELIWHPPAGDAPEVALLWPVDVGAPRFPPAPRVLFPDEGHPERALSYRLEALVERLRNTQELTPLLISPPLQAVAERRARALAAQGRLGHRLPQGQSAIETLAIEGRGPSAPFVGVSELQAQAGTLAEAFAALLESPAHRYELVHPGRTHLGAFVAKGEDARGRPLISVVVLVAERPSLRPEAELRAELFARINLARHARGLMPLRSAVDLAQAAGRMAHSLAGRATIARETAEAVGSRHLAEVGLLRSDVGWVVARLDDPLRLVPPPVTLGEATVAAIGLAPGTGGWYLCVLVAERP